VDLVDRALARGRVTSPRVRAMLLIRRARAHSIAADPVAAYQAIGDIDAAVDTARQTVALMGGVTSARGTTTLTDLLTNLARHRQLPAVAGFLGGTS
jgi:hypothetical protein